MNTTIESEKNAAAADVSQPKAEHAATKKAKPVKKAIRANKPASRPTADRASIKAEVIALMKCAKGATLAENMEATGLAGAHRAQLRQHPQQQGRGEHRVPPQPVGGVRPALTHSSEAW